MRKLTTVEKLMLSQNMSTFLVAKTVICLSLNLTTPKGSKELVGVGLYREGVREILDADGVLTPTVYHEAQMLVCGKGLFNWWATTIWAPCQPRPQFFSKAINVSTQSKPEHKNYGPA